MFSKKEMLPEEEIRQVEERLKVLNTDFVLPQSLSTQELHKRLTPEDCRNFREAGHPDFMYWQRYAGMVASFIVVLVGLVMVSSGMISLDNFAPAPAMPEMAAAEAEVAAMDMDEMGVAEAALYDGAEAEEAAETKMAAAGRSRLYASDYDDIAAALQQASYAAVGAPTAQNGEADAGSTEELAVPDATWQNVFSDVPGESPDILKSDGTYFYYYCAPTTVGQSGKVYIIKAETLEIVSSVSTGIAQGTELFIRDGRLVLISRNHKDAATVLYDAAVLTDRQGQSVEARQLAETAAQRAEAYGFTTVSVYDLSDITKPVLVRSFMQDGLYQNSRLVGGRMYLFTRKHLDGALATDENALLCDTLPVVRDSLSNGSATLSADRVVKAPGSSQGVYTTVSMFDVSADRQVVTNSVLGSPQSYLSDGSVYFCYDAGEQTTGILRMTVGLDMNVVGQTLLKGDFDRPMAINRSDNFLRVGTVTVDAAGREQSNVYLMDEAFYPVGSVEGLGQGEKVTDLRFIGDTVYITSQRESRPVLGLDLSNPADPTILGQLDMQELPETFRLINGDRVFGLREEQDGSLHLVFRNNLGGWNGKETEQPLPGASGSSIAQSDHRALLYNNDHQIIGFPVVLYQAGGKLQNWGYATYRLDNDILIRNPIITHAEILNESIDQQHRSVLRGRIIEDRLYTFSGSMIKVHDLTTMYEEKVLRIH